MSSAGVLFNVMLLRRPSDSDGTPRNQTAKEIYGSGVGFLMSGLGDRVVPLLLTLGLVWKKGQIRTTPIDLFVSMYGLNCGVHEEGLYALSLVKPLMRS